MNQTQELTKLNEEIEKNVFPDDADLPDEAPEDPEEGEDDPSEEEELPDDESGEEP